MDTALEEADQAKEAADDAERALLQAQLDEKDAQIALLSRECDHAVVQWGEALDERDRAHDVAREALANARDSRDGRMCKNGMSTL